MLKAERLEVWRGPNLVLSDFSLFVAPGSVTALLGGNGSGKSTALYALSGLVPVKSGRIILDERDLTGRSTREMLEAGISHVPQGREIFPSLTVRENLEAGGTILRGRKERQERIEKVVDRFPMLREKLKRPAGMLSGGEQQQLAIARALIPDPKILLMDEPSAGLSPVMVDVLIDTILSVRDSGLTVFLVEQNVGVAASAADEALVLKSGAIALRKPAKELFADREILSAYLGR